MGLGGYLKELPGLMNMLNNYIKDSVENRNFSKTYRKYHIWVTFTQTQDKVNNDKIRQK